MMMQQGQQCAVVYTLPNCMQRTMTTRALDTAGLAYTVVDLVTQLSHSSAPVDVAVSGDHWSGFRPDRIAVTATMLSAAKADNA